MSEDEVLSNVLSVVRPFLKKNVDLTPDTPLMESGLLDSINFVQIMLGLDQTFGPSADLETLSFEDCQSCRRLTQAIVERRNVGSV